MIFTAYTDARTKPAIMMLFHPPFQFKTTEKVATDSWPESSTSIAEQDGTRMQLMKWNKFSYPLWLKVITIISSSTAPSRNTYPLLLNTINLGAGQKIWKKPSLSQDWMMIWKLSEPTSSCGKCAGCPNPTDLFGLCSELKEKILKNCYSRILSSWQFIKPRASATISIIKDSLGTQ